ncbi:MAG: right-handed parallel beta-helix repeat-containing protein [bacterium]|nr:right-handed parallel beta-helix repeat-containing protein [bacterium]
MRSVILFLFTVFAVGAAQARVLIADNNPTPLKGDHVFSTLPEAIAAASGGDVIQLVPSETSYGQSVVITKKLKIVGSGFDITGEARKRSTVHGIVINSGTGTVLTGLKILNGDGFNTGVSIGQHGEEENIVIENCEVQGVSINRSSNIFIRNCIVNGGIKIIASKNVLIANNFMLDANISAGGAGNQEETTGVAITNNLFFHVPLDIGRITLGSLRNVTFSNNLLFASGFPQIYFDAEIRDNTFSHNLYFSGGVVPAAGYELVEGAFPTTQGNASSGNLVDVDPQFVKGVPSNTTRIDLTPGAARVLPNVQFLFDFDFRVRDGSPARNAGSDGTDIGIFGGTYPFRAYLTGGSSVPQVQELVTSGVVKKGSPLKVSVKARGN